MCGGAFIIVFVCAYVRGGGGVHPRLTGTKVGGGGRYGCTVTVWCFEIEKAVG